MRERCNNPETPIGSSEAYRRAAKLLEGLMDSEVPSEVKLRLQDWFASDVSADEKYTALKELFEGMEENPIPDRYDYESLRKIQEIIGFPRQYMTRLPAQKISLCRRLLRLAMVIIPALLITAIAFTLTRNIEEAVVVAENNVLTVSTSEGEQKNIFLPDSSRVWLNHGTTISYTVEDGRRTVYLEGEAYFQVQSVPGSRFSVETEKLTATVLGTRFNVSAFAGEQTEVVLDEGSLEIVSHNQKAIMKPADKVKIPAQGKEILFEEFSPGMVAGWRRGLDFSDTALSDVLVATASYFNMELEINGALPDDVIRFGFDHDASPETVLSVLSNTLEYFSCRIVPDKIIIMTD